MYLTITSQTDGRQLQRDLDQLSKWEGSWMMNFHPDKCNVLSISKKRKPITRDYILHSHTLEQVTSAKYLGVTITSDMKWNTHIANMCQKANNTLSFLKRNPNIGNPNIKGMAYKSLVRPILEYACNTWDPYQQNNIYKMEMVQRQNTWISR